MPVLAVVTLFSMIAGLGLQLAGDAQKSKAEQDEANANKRLAEAAAADALDRGRREAGQMRMAGSQLASEQKVAYAASGVDPTVGTAANVQAGTKAQTELEALTLENNAAREAWGFKTHGIQYAQAAQREREVAPYRQAGTILGGVGRMSAFASSYVK